MTWRHDAERTLTELIESGFPFTEDDLRRHTPGKPPHPNMLCTLITAAAVAGRIHHIGDRRASLYTVSAGSRPLWMTTTPREGSA